ncbi:hypothetical protein GN244_ATG13724 [Phytophthora infestans]|uniref:Uncharacterized protein n=1 Tax=Phytophthora infestans TaxID=4787 RepID=A0A833S6D6_PHYIN|nr:hypothetical protein GN244_ATG13724 [Phytophthora infestans]
MCFQVCFLEKIDVVPIVEVHIPERAKPTRFCLCRRAKSFYVLRDTTKRLLRVIQVRFCCGGARRRFLPLAASGFYALSASERTSNMLRMCRTGIWRKTSRNLH